MTARLDAYLALERVMLLLEDAGDPLADNLRDVMDPVWYALSDEEHAVLDAREIGTATSLHPIRFPLGSEVFVKPAEPVGPLESIRDQNVGREFDGWKRAA